MKNIKILPAISLLLLSVFGPMCGGNGSENTIVPGTLLIYYGWPSMINGSASVSDASIEFGRYDYAVLGAGLEEASHGDHSAAVQIMNDPDNSSTVFFGYVDLGVTTSNFSIADIKIKIDEWKVSGADGIFLDDFGYDYGVTRSRQNEAVSYAHSAGLAVVANAWNPDDAFGNEIDSSWNPAGVSTELGSGDYYLAESSQIEDGGYQSGSDWFSKVNRIKVFRDLIGFHVLSVTTNDAADVYDSDKFFYSWYSALLAGYTAAGWGEFDFSSDDNYAPYRARPGINPGRSFSGWITDESPLYHRDTNSGRIWINTVAHTCGFTR